MLGSYLVGRLNGLTGTMGASFVMMDLALAGAAVLTVAATARWKRSTV